MRSHLLYLFIVYSLERLSEICHEGLYSAVVLARITSSYLEWKHFGALSRKHSDEYFPKINVRSPGHF